MQMHIYQYCMIAGAFLSLNFLMKVQRDKDVAQRYVDDIKGEVKNVVNKKND